MQKQSDLGSKVYTFVDAILVKWKVFTTAPLLIAIVAIVASTEISSVAATGRVGRLFHLDGGARFQPMRLLETISRNLMGEFFHDAVDGEGSPPA